MHALSLQVDGARVAVRRFAAPDLPRGAIVIGGAMGVRQQFYTRFATWLAAQGFDVTTFDYRGSGDSLLEGETLRGVRANLSDWTRDYEAVIDDAHAALQRRSDGAPLYLFGHSLGAQLPGMLGNAHKVSGLLGIASGSGYWRDNAPRFKAPILYFWHVAVPLFTRLFGYFPGKRLRKVGDLPAGVILQWRRWCLDPLYSFGAEGEAARKRYGDVRFPVLALSMTDDELMTLRGTQTLLGFYANAPRGIERVQPADVQAGRIGHFGFFRDQFSSSLWPRAVESITKMGTLTVPVGVPRRTA